MSSSKHSDVQPDDATIEQGHRASGDTDVPPAFEPVTETAGPPEKAAVPRRQNRPQRISYRRRLPHQVPPGCPIFLTWNLNGSLPKQLLQQLEQERRQLKRQQKRENETARQRAIRHGKLMFAKCDTCLDQLAAESHHNRNLLHDRAMWLADPKAAAIIVESLVWGVNERYSLHSFVVMANHVHVLLTPTVELSVVTKGIKGWTARQINRLLGRRGVAVWQHESYDHWARDEGEMFRIIDYIERNPVTAGLCQFPEQWLWSSARWREPLGWKPGEPFQAPWKETVKRCLNVPPALQPVTGTEQPPGKAAVPRENPS